MRIGQYGAFGEGAAKVRMRQRFAQGNALVAEAVQRVAQFEAAHADALPFSFRAWRLPFAHGAAGRDVAAGVHARVRLDAVP